MNKGLFKFDYMVYDGNNASTIAEEFSLDYEEINDRMIIDSVSGEETVRKGDCLIRVPGWICVISQKDFKEKFMGDIEEHKTMNKFEVVRDEYRVFPQAEIKLPVRGTKFSAGYDICTPCKITIPSGESIKIATDIKARVKEDEVLLLFVRSSIGIKKNVVLMNGTGIIDADYYSNSDNDGNIILALYNYGKESAIFQAGDRICQGVFVKYDTVEDDNVAATRTGGIGSTN